jgi:chromate transporter
VIALSILPFSQGDWFALFVHFLSLSLLAIGGAITTAPAMHAYLVDSKAWLSDEQFTASIALAQAAPGPNVLFIAVLGWNVGFNAGGGAGAGMQAWLLAALGATIAMAGMLLPSTTLTFAASRWAHRNRELRAVRAFKQGMAPVIIALLMATGWILLVSQANPLHQVPLWLIAVITALLVWKTRIHLLWILTAGALLGALGLV